MGSFSTFLFLLKAVDWLEAPNEGFFHLGDGMPLGDEDWTWCEDDDGMDRAGGGNSGMNGVEDDDGVDRAGSGNGGMNGVEDNDGMERAGGGNGGMNGVEDNDGTGRAGGGSMNRVEDNADPAERGSHGWEPWWAYVPLAFDGEKTPMAT